jgi:putative DNA methylase
MHYRKKLIEVALPLEAINKEAAHAKRKAPAGYPTTIHKWWAQRPIAACRAVLFASLVDDPSECVAELMKDSAKRQAAENEFKARTILFNEQKVLLAKAPSGENPASQPGPKPKLEDIVAEIERDRLFDIIRELVKWEYSNDERVLNAARAEIMRSCNGNPPPVYDPFCGGGSIPLEAQRLGLQAKASDLNPIPVLINKALIEIPPKFTRKPPVNPESRKKLGASGSWKGVAGLAEDIRYYGEWMSSKAEQRIGHLYPKVKLPRELGGGEATVIAWLWARTVISPNPVARGAHVPLISSFWLSKKPGKKAWLEPVVEPGTMIYSFKVQTGTPTDETPIKCGTKTARGANFRCVLTDCPIESDYIKLEGRGGRMGSRLLAIVADGKGRRIYLPPDPEQEALALTALPTWSPEEPLANDPRNIWCIPYGFTHLKHLFTKRQLVALSCFSDLIGEVKEEVRKDSHGDSTYADAIATYLACAMSRCVDYGNAICTWRPKDNAMRSGLAKQAIPMAWDYAEGNPFGDSSSGFIECVYVVAKCLEKLPEAKQLGIAWQRDATTPIEGTFIYSTDPPYYDNISYADLSDFFYVWHRRSLQSIYPELFGTIVVPKTPELVATPNRHGGNRAAAKRFFEEGLGTAFASMRNSVHNEFPVTVYYAFKQSEEEEETPMSADENKFEIEGDSRANTGWETMLSGLMGAGFSINGTWPMRTEGDNRQVGIGTNALASSILLVCRPRPKNAGVTSRRDFLAALKKELPDALRAMQKGNIAPVDLAQAAIGPGMAVFSRYDKVLEIDGKPMGVRTALSIINQSLDEVLAEQEGEFDVDTRWALSWFDQNGFSEGAYGIAETLCTAKNTSVSGMVEAGFLVAKGGKVRLLKKEELAKNWDPATDKRLTSWEITHHLIRRLEQGESGAAELIQKLGAKAEVARDLSYRLYTICERRKWANEASAYNTLVLSWGDVVRLAEEKKAAVTLTQGEMNL